MTSSSTVTETATFTLTHAKYLASKIVTDLKRIQRLYGRPSDSIIANYEQEVTALLKGGFLKRVTYGFRRDDKFIEPTLIYTSQALMTSEIDDDPGRILPGKNIEGADFWSYLERNAAWDKLSPEEKAEFNKDVRIKRVGAPQPGHSGYVTGDLNYSSGGQALERSQVRSYL